MPRTAIAIALVIGPLLLPAADSRSATAPAYSVNTIQSLASGKSRDIAVNSIISIRGERLSYTTRAREEDDAVGDLLPVSLPGTFVTVQANGLLCSLEYVSPEVVIFLLPPNLAPGNVNIKLTRSGITGPTVRVQANATAPALFHGEGHWVLARHADSMEWIAEGSEAAPGETVIVYASGLGQTTPPQLYLAVPRVAAALASQQLLRVTLAGVELDRSAVVFAGIAENQPGIYELRIRLPVRLAENPELRIGMGDDMSPTGARLRVRPPSAQPGEPILR